MTEELKPQKILIAFTTAQFWATMIAVLGFAVMFWHTTLNRLDALENKANFGEGNTGRIENKVDNLILKFFDLNDNMIKIKTILDIKSKTPNF